MAQDLKTFILGIVLIGLTLVFGIFIASTMEGNFWAENTAGTQIANETGYLNATGYTLAKASERDFSLGTTVILDATDNTTIGSGNYTFTGGVLTNATATTWDSVYITYDYTYTADTDASTASASLVTSLSSGSGWIIILVIVGFAVIVLAMLTDGLGGLGAMRQTRPEYAY